MMIQAMISECDITGQKFSQPVMGYHLFARGNTGRVCCVIHASEGTVPGEPVTLDALEAWAESVPGGYLDY